MEYFETEEHKKELINDFYDNYNGEVFDFKEMSFENGMLIATFFNEYEEQRFLKIAYDKFGEVFKIITLEEIELVPEINYDNLRYKTHLATSPIENYTNLEEFIESERNRFMLYDKNDDFTDVKGVKNYSFGVGYSKEVQKRFWKETVLCEKYDDNAKKVYYFEINK